jgi:hypothetical protein
MSENGKDHLPEQRGDKLLIEPATDQKRSKSLIIDQMPELSFLASKYLLVPLAIMLREENLMRFLDFLTIFPSGTPILSILGNVYRSYRADKRFAVNEGQIRVLMSMVDELDIKYHMLGEELVKLTNGETSVFFQQLLNSCNDSETRRHILAIVKALKQECEPSKAQGYARFFFDSIKPDVFISEQQTLLKAYESLAEIHLYILRNMLSVERAALSEAVKNQMDLPVSSYKFVFTSSNGDKAFVTVREEGSGKYLVTFPADSISYIVSSESSPFILAWMKDIENTGLVNSHSAYGGAQIWSISDLMRKFKRYIHEKLYEEESHN